MKVPRIYSALFSITVLLIFVLLGFNIHQHKKRILVLLFSFVTHSLVFAQTQTSVVETGAKLVKLSGEFKFTEGPAVDKVGNIYFTDQPNDRIMKWSIDEKLTTFMQPSGRSNGLYFDLQGKLIACADNNNELWIIDLNGNRKTILNNYEGKLLNGPNDAWVRPQDNAIYFTDPFYKRDYWKRGPMEQDGQHVYYVSPDRKTVKRVASDLTQPNGIIGTPDGSTLYIADIGAWTTFVFDINKDGTLDNKRIFCSMGSDGMTIDSEGNIYLTGQGVTVFNSEGKKISTISVPEEWTANVSIGGKDHKTLFITASMGLYAIKLRVKGVY